jgi:hypothetical protein
VTVDPSSFLRVLAMVKAIFLPDLKQKNAIGNYLDWMDLLAYLYIIIKRASLIIFSHISLPFNGYGSNGTSGRSFLA